LDGFTITGGNANGAYGSNHSYGGGMYNYGSSPTVTNCTFIGNSAYKCGGGMYNDGSSSPTVRNCIFNGNYNYDIPFTWSGGMYNDGGSSPTVTNCLFKNNVTLGIYGGGNVTNCILWGNGWGEISGDASVTYSDIEIEGEGVYTGVGNINADPMFAADGYHLTLCSLCIDAGTNTPPGGLPEEDIDGEERIMGCADEPRVDMGVDEYYTSDCNVFLRAHCPKPACGTADVPRDVVLCWRPGVDANKHDVYFGTDRTAVINANDPYTPPGRGRQDSNCYDPCTDDPNQCYYWRIDEVNDANIWRGDVWYFRVVPDCNVVENFNSYTEDTLGEVWKDHWNQEDPITQSWLYLKLGIDDANFVRGGKDSNSIRYAYENHLSPWYSEAYADIDYLPSQIGRDWTANGVKALVLWFYGQASNPVTEQMYIKLTDGDGDSGTVMYGDMSDIKEPEWHKWSIDLALFDARGVNLANVSRITIGFGDGIAPGYDGLVYIEDIQLCAGKCLGECAPEYADWVAWGKPNCWCFKRQCRGDADGVKTGGVWVQTYDLNLLKSAFNKADTIVKNIPNGICADLNHAKTGGVRVQTLDLNILKSFFNKAETSVPCCDADKDGTLTTLDKYNFWTN
jgi:parallel beta-helix repeat protein